MDPHPYRDVFGKPGTGVHGIRFANLPVADTALTLVAAGLTTHYFHVPTPLSTCGWLAAGIALHRLFGVRTTIDKLLFG